MKKDRSIQLSAIPDLADAPKFTDINDASRYATEFVMKKYKLKYENDINQGYCYIWAYIVWALMPAGSVKFVSSNAHVAIECESKYYDATTFGTFDIDSIMCHNEIMELSIEDMSWYWCRMGTYRRFFRDLLKKTCNYAYEYASKCGFPDDGKCLCAAIEYRIEDVPSNSIRIT
jgi:hypothetical protein